jgi:hypothetical protein
MAEIAEMAQYQFLFSRWRRKITSTPPYPQVSQGAQLHHYFSQLVSPLTQLNLYTGAGSDFIGGLGSRGEGKGPTFRCSELRA